LAEALTKAGYHAIAVNPGDPGERDVTDRDLTLHDLAGDLAEIIETMKAGPVHALGHAFGNRVVRCLAADRPDLIQTVVLLAAGGLVKPDQEVIPALGRVIMGDLSQEMWLREIKKTGFFATATDPLIWREGWRPEVAAGQKAAMDATPFEDWWSAGDAAILVVQGLEDGVAPPENGRALKAELGERVCLVELENAGHALLCEQPQAVAEAVIAFLRKHAAT
jgi:pimeloyl-ACP methyl ester carboxylesterase